MKSIRFNGDKKMEFEISIYDSLVSIGDIMWNYDGYKTVKCLKALIDECRGYVYEEAHRYKREKKRERIIRNMLIMISLCNLILGILIGIYL